MTSDDDAIVSALSGILIDLVLDGRLGPGHGSRTAAEALIAELDRRGLRIVGARTGTLAGSRSSDVSLAQYQQILGERNHLQAQVDAKDQRITELLEANNREVERRRAAEASAQAAEGR